MSFCAKNKIILMLVFLFAFVPGFNYTAAESDSTAAAHYETTNVEIDNKTDTSTAIAAGKPVDWYNISRYNAAGNFTYSLIKTKMSGNLKEAGTDYAGSNHKLSYLLMGSNSGWDISNYADLTYSSWKKRMIADVFRLEAVKGDITINAGDFYPSYSSITLDGLIVHGLGVKKIYDERLTVQTFIAKSQRAVEPVKEDSNRNSVIDPGEDLNGNNILDVKEGDFSQNMLGGRVENKFSGFFDAGINFISARDDMSSIPNPQSVDSTSVLYPVLENNILGIDGHLHFFEDRLKIDSEYGEGSYRRGNSDTTFIDQASNIKLSFLSKIWLTKMVYQKVDPNYHSEGNPYMETDKKGYNLENEFILSKEYSFVGNYQKYNNNVNKLDFDTTIDTKQQEFKLKYYPKSGSKEFKYRNTAKNGRRQGEKDTIDDTYVITIRRDYSDNTWITYNLQYSKYHDRLINTNDYNGYSGYFSLNWDIKKDILNLTPYFNYNLYKYKNLSQKQIYYLTNIQSRIMLWKDKWALVPYVEYDYTSQNGNKVLERFSRDIESKFYVSNRISLGLKYGILNNNDVNDLLDYSVEKVGGEITVVF